MQNVKQNTEEEIFLFLTDRPECFKQITGWKLFIYVAICSTCLLLAICGHLMVGNNGNILREKICDKSDYRKEDANLCFHSIP